MKEFVVPFYCVVAVFGYGAMFFGLIKVGKPEWQPFLLGAFLVIYIIGFLIACLVKNITP